MCSACCNAVHDKRRKYGLYGFHVDINLEPSGSERSLDAIIRQKVGALIARKRMSARRSNRLWVQSNLDLETPRSMFRIHQSQVLCSYFKSM